MFKDSGLSIPLNCAFLTTTPIVTSILELPALETSLSLLTGLGAYIIPSGPSPYVNPWGPDPYVTIEGPDIYVTLKGPSPCVTL